MPRFSVRTWGGRLAVVLSFSSIAAALTVPEYFFFPFAVLYITYGLVRAVVAGFEERLAEEEPMVLSEADAETSRELDYEEIRPGSTLRPEGRPMDQEAT
jgi:hypothetical protein